MRWISKSEYVDLDTGEVINKETYEKEYYKVKQHKKIKHDGKEYGYITYTNECRKRPKQSEIFKTD